MSNRVRMLVAVATSVGVLACAAREDAGTCALSAPAPRGPGDAANHFPVAVGSRWLYERSGTSAGLPLPVTRSSMTVTGTRDVGGGATASVFTSALPDGSAPYEEALFSKGPSGVTQYATATDGPPFDRMLPNQLIEFPLAAGSSFQQFTCTNLDAGEDLDGDGKRERLDASSTVTVSAAETVVVPAGTFLAVRVDTTVAMTIRATSGQTASAWGTESTWYAPGVGAVRSSSSFSDGMSADTTDEVLLGYDVEGSRAGLQWQATLQADVQPALFDSRFPGRPALSFDGARHLVLTGSDPDVAAWGDESLEAFVLGPDGTRIRDVVPWNRTGYVHGSPAAAFDGTNHLAIAALGDAVSSTIVGQRITPAGDLLDGPDGFAVTPDDGRLVFDAAIASDGSGWLVAWSRYPGGIEAARVSGSGEVLGTSVVRASATARYGAVAFGGGVSLVAWIEDGSVLAARVDANGAVLDDPPIAVSTAASVKSMGGVAFDGTRFLVVWGDSRLHPVSSGGAPEDVWAARVSVDGTLLDGPADAGGIPVDAGSDDANPAPAVAFDGGDFVVAWVNAGTLGGIFATRVTGDGLVPGGPVAATGPRIARPPALGALGWWLVHPAVAPAAGGETLFAWVSNTDAAGAMKHVDGAFYAW